MLLDQPRLTSMLLDTSRLWLENAQVLSEIDSRFGDGDHGVTISKIARLIASSAESWKAESLKAFITDLGSAIMEIGGGSAGPLYGTMIGGLAEALTDEKEIDAPLLKKMLTASLAEMCSITKARVGDKTMMDALIPAVEAATAAGDEVELVLAAAASGAAGGAEVTRSQISRFGRARSYGEQTIGTQDAGALSTALFFQGLAGA
ncbi:MAG: dihydroxyacetone kinase subunit L [Deltaproteobacteria bacterium]|jgi:dihydroxyacetone kinase-like protein|nr:dihydroxyacetone kinase subunit L [Deltaproteobacteria bacterium]